MADRSLARFGFSSSFVNISGVQFASVHALPLVALFLFRGHFKTSAALARKKNLLCAKTCPALTLIGDRALAFGVADEGAFLRGFRKV